MSNKIKIGISSCLLGNNVRYDGGNKLDQTLIDALGPFVEWVPLCPEVEAGLPVPREPMQLVADGTRTRLVTVETKQDQTEILARWAEKKMKQSEHEGISGFIFKARSPSCAVDDARIVDRSGILVKNGQGIFTRILVEQFPDLPVADEEKLNVPAEREAFRERIYAYSRRHFA